MRKIAILGLLLLALFAVNGAVYAGSIRLSSGGINWEIADGGAGDINLVPGAVTFSGTVGSWVVNVTTGLSYPVIGSPANPMMDLCSVDVSSSLPGTPLDPLTILFSDAGFLNTGGANILIGGVTGGTLTYNAYWDPGNTLFATTNSLNLSEQFSQGAFSGMFSGAAPASSPYSLTQEVVISHPAGIAVTSFNASISVPEPSLILLLGIGIMGISVCWRKFV
jgi:hypothetical protein